VERQACYTKKIGGLLSKTVVASFVYCYMNSLTREGGQIWHVGPWMDDWCDSGGAGDGGRRRATEPSGDHAGIRSDSSVRPPNGTWLGSIGS
jgi:hypothetical protein